MLPDEWKHCDIILEYLGGTLTFNAIFNTNSHQEMIDFILNFESIAIDISVARSVFTSKCFLKANIAICLEEDEMTVTLQCKTDDGFVNIICNKWNDAEEADNTADADADAEEAGNADAEEAGNADDSDDEAEPNIWVD